MLARTFKASKRPSLGGGDLPDGSDGFQNFQNGAATACFAYFYVQALYEMGRYEDGEAILGPLMRGYAEGIFQDGQGGRGEWRRWDGTPSGLEGYLADSYHAHMALFTGHFGLRVGPHGFSLADWSPLKGQRVKLGLRWMGRIVEHVE